MRENIMYPEVFSKACGSFLKAIKTLDTLHSNYKHNNVAYDLD